MEQESKKLKGVEAVRQALKNIPDSCGVYQMIDGKGEVIYVGKAKSLKKRVGNYASLEKNPYRIMMMISNIHEVEIVTTNTEAEALLLEANLIKKHSPRYNILLKDDKSFPYILITRGEFPMIMKHRGAKSQKGHYFGPFANVDSVHKTIAMIQRSFLIRICSDSVFESRKRPCLEYQIKRCSAPCVGRIDKENYGKLVSDALDLLSGKETDLPRQLAGKMESLSREMKFEEAAVYRDRIQAISTIRASQFISMPGLKDSDVVAIYTDNGVACIQVMFFRNGQNLGSKSFFPTHLYKDSGAEIAAAFLTQFYRNTPPPPEIVLSHMPEDENIITEALSEIAGSQVKIHVPQRGEKLGLIKDVCAKAEEALGRKMREEASQKALFQELQNRFNLDSLPERIEVFDNSHIMGTDAIGAMIVAGPEGFIKNSYRKYNIRSEMTAGDDYAMLREVLCRRYGKLKKENPTQKEGIWPDLILIDGGAGHLKVAEEVFADLGINDVVFSCIAKGPERNAGKEIFHISGKPPFSLPMNDPVLYLLQRLRDEAHRFAISTHRAKRGKAIVKSELDSIEGIGAKRKKALLSYFGSVKAIKEASIEDLLKVDGIEKKIAKTIYNHLHT